MLTWQEEEKSDSTSFASPSHDLSARRNGVNQLCGATALQIGNVRRTAPWSPVSHEAAVVYCVEIRDDR